MASRPEIEQRYEGKKTIAVLFWIGGAVCFLIILLINWSAWKGGKPIDAALRDLGLFGLLPAIVFYFVGRLILRRSLAAQEEDEEFRRDADFLQYFHRKGRATFEEIQQEFGLQVEEIRGYLIHLGGKRLFRGYVDWRNEEVVSIGEVEISEECPACSSRLNYLDPQVGICDDCGLQVFK
jgi:hypothetical protein